MRKETKTIFIYPTGGVWQGQMEAISESVDIPDGYTDIQPPQPAFKVKFIDGKWVETATDEEIASMQLHDAKPQPTPEQQMIAALMAKVTELEAKK